MIDRSVCSDCENMLWLTIFFFTVRLTGDSKVNTICNLIAHELNQKPNKLDYTNCILTALVCKKPADYQAALTMLADIKRKLAFCPPPSIIALSCSDIAPLDEVQDVGKVDDAIKYIIFLSDADELYKVALSMYDLSLVVLIAQYSQKVRLYIHLDSYGLPCPMKPTLFCCC